MIKNSSIVYGNEMLENGYYVETVIEEETFPIFDIFSKEKTKKGTKTSRYKDPSGTVEWTVSVHGTFTYTENVSSKCTKSTVSTTCPNSDWKIISSSASKSSNSASAKATTKKRLNASSTLNHSISVKLICDKNGVLN